MHSEQAFTNGDVEVFKGVCIVLRNSFMGKIIKGITNGVIAAVPLARCEPRPRKKHPETVERDTARDPGQPVFATNHIGNLNLGSAGRKSSDPRDTAPSDDCSPG